MLTDENQAVQITLAAAVALGLSTKEATAKEASEYTPEERATAHKLVEAMLAHAVELAVVAPRRFVDLRQV